MPPEIKLPSDLQKFSPVRRNVIGCARCGKDHPSLPFLKFNRPPEPFTHWARCPVTAEPILMQFAKEGDDAA